MSPVSQHGFRRSFTLVAGAMALALSLFGLTQCRMTKTVTGLSGRESGGSFANDRSACERECQEAYKSCRDQEQERHQVGTRNCGSLSGDERLQCAKSENVRHLEATQTCLEIKEACKAACRYSEGSGVVGR